MYTFHGEVIECMILQLGHRMYTFYGFTPYIHILRLQTYNTEIVHITMCSGMIFFLSMNQILLWYGSIHYYVANDYLHNKIHDIHAVQGLGGIIEMMRHIKKSFANIIRQLPSVGSSLRVQGLGGINEIMMHIKKTYANIIRQLL